MVENLLPQHHYRTHQVETDYLYNRSHTTKQLEKSISYRTAKVWNDIPLTLKNFVNPTTMKNKWQGMEIDFFKNNN